MTRVVRTVRWLPVLVALAVGCADLGADDAGGDGGGDRGAAADAAWVCTDPAADTDGDGISDGLEACSTDRDSDGDGVPDWRDLDSDGDGIGDSVEAGERDSAGRCRSPAGTAWPCDSDGDGLADYVDLDSDGDGLDDGDEDHNGDGRLGCCLSRCNKPGSTQAKVCLLTKDGCGTGQTCASGACTPAAALDCSEGETDPRKKDTFGDGTPDTRRGGFICRDATESRPGRKPVQVRTDTAGDWKVALETGARYGALAISGAAAGTAAAVIDHDGATEEVAGFVVSRPATAAGVQAELSDLVAAVTKDPPGGGGAVWVQASGVQGKTHDRYDTVRGTQLALSLKTHADASTVRNDLVARLLGRPRSALKNLPAAYARTSTSFTVRFTTVRRFAFKKDASGKPVLDATGYPLDSGDAASRRLVVIGAVADTSRYQDLNQRTGIVADDLSGGTALALASDTVGNECDARKVKGKPKADIVWVSDESGSMKDNRDDVVRHAGDFFKRALAMGLDFRMGVTNVVPPSAVGHGKFCSVASSQDSDSGGIDRFLLPMEQATFVACVRNPPGYTGGHAPGEYGLENARAALLGHLPRAAADATNFRKSASIAIIVLTDQIPVTVETAISQKSLRSCKLDPQEQAQTNALLQPLVEVFSGTKDPESRVANFFAIAGTCTSTCSAHVAHDYNELARQFNGQVADICQKDLGTTLRAFLNTIVAGAGAIGLDRAPIASSLAVTLDGKQVLRSRASGFDYRPESNGLVLYNTTFNVGSEVVASYKRWERQVSVE